jgi:hypothetical protein
MSNAIFFILLGGASAVAIGLGYSWEPIATMAGAVMGVYAIVKADIKAAISERILRRIAKETGTNGQLRRDLRGRLSRLFQRVRQPSACEPPGGRAAVAGQVGRAGGREQRQQNC